MISDKARRIKHEYVQDEEMQRTTYVPLSYETWPVQLLSCFGHIRTVNIYG